MFAEAFVPEGFCLGQEKLQLLRHWQEASQTGVKKRGKGALELIRNKSQKETRGRVVNSASIHTHTHTPKKSILGLTGVYGNKLNWLGAQNDVH